MTNIVKITFGNGDTYQFATSNPTCILEINGKPMVGLQNVEDNGICVGIYPDGEQFRTLEVVTLPEGKDVHDMSFDELLAASSFGSPEAFALARTMDPEDRKRFENKLDEVRSKLVESDPEFPYELSDEDADRLYTSVQEHIADEEKARTNMLALYADDGRLDRLRGADSLAEDIEAMKSYGPWDEDQVMQLERFQDYGTFHPFTCPNHDELTREINLWVREDALYCPVSGCDYTQDWVWLGMLDPANVLDSIFSNPLDKGCTCALQRSEDGWQVVEWSEICKVHPQLKGTVYDKTTAGKHAGIRPMHLVGAKEHNEALVAKDEKPISEWEKEDFDKALGEGTPVEVEVNLKRD